jgi:hypothetical protein
VSLGVPRLPGIIGGGSSGLTHRSARTVAVGASCSAKSGAGYLNLTKGSANLLV